MEAALAMTGNAEPTAVEHIRAHLALAEKSSGVAVIAGGSAAALEKWLLAIGLRMTAEGRFARAQEVLREALARYPDSADVQLAWGTLREIEATVPPEVFPDSTARTGPTVPRRIGQASVDWARRQVMFARAAWDASAREAHQALARAAQLAPGSAEAQLRLAHVEMLQGQDASAASRLEPIVATAADRRMAYMARLFLADISQRGNDRQRAEALLEQAIGLVPSGQAAHLALAQLARDAGEFERAAVLLHRMMNAAVKPDDPWVAYRFGQFWVADELIRQLREEARKQS
jgi:tetratricopeptide (TPR) repeat protein